MRKEEKLKDKLKWYAEEFEKINNEIDSKNFLSHYDFLRIRNFKLQSLSMTDERCIEDVTKEAFDLAKQNKIEESVKKLVDKEKGLHGVRVPIASAILAMRFPEEYAIIDKRVIRQLEKEGHIKKSEKIKWLKNYSKEPNTDVIRVYKDYLILMRKLAKEKNLREFERELFEKSYAIKL